MQLFIRTLTGKTITLSLEPSIHKTWLDLKRQILAEENIRIDLQRIIVSGYEMQDNDLLNYQELMNLETIHLILRFRAEINLETHKLYVTVHNFYEDINDAKILSLQHVIPINGEESQEQLREIFETIYRRYQQRIEKNTMHQQYFNREGTLIPQANPVVAIVAVKKAKGVVLVPSDSTTSALISPDEELDLSLFSYMLGNGVAVTGQINDAATRTSREIANISQAFRLFCAEKQASNPQFLQGLRTEALRNFGEVASYLEYTADFVFEDKTNEQKLEIIAKVHQLCMGIELGQADPQYEDAMQLYVVAITENFQIVKTKLHGKYGQERETTLNDCRNSIRALLLNKLMEYENQFTAERNRQQSQPVIEVARNHSFFNGDNRETDNAVIGQQTNSSLSQEQILKIQRLRDSLADEVNSCRPYFNKDRKLVKIDALDELINLTSDYEVADAVTIVKNKYQSRGLIAGFFSTRTSNLLAELETDNHSSLRAGQ